MYKSVDHALKSVYLFFSRRIEPLNNTAQVMHWIESKGVRAGGGEMTQQEWHANAAMIMSRVERVLNRFELAAVKCQYGNDFSGVVDLTAFIETRNLGVNLLLCDDIIMHVFTGRPRRVDIMDRYDISNGHFYRQHTKIKGVISALLDSATIKLQAEFEECGILDAERVH